MARPKQELNRLHALPYVPLQYELTINQHDIHEQEQIIQKFLKENVFVDWLGLIENAKSYAEEIREDTPRTNGRLHEDLNAQIRHMKDIKSQTENLIKNLPILFNSLSSNPTHNFNTYKEFIIKYVNDPTYKEYADKKNTFCNTYTWETNQTNQTKRVNDILNLFNFICSKKVAYHMGQKDVVKSEYHDIIVHSWNSFWLTELPEPEEYPYYVNLLQEPFLEYVDENSELYKRDLRSKPIYSLPVGGGKKRRNKSKKQKHKKMRRSRRFRK